MILGSPVVDGKYIFSSKNVYLFLCNDYYSVYSTTVLITRGPLQLRGQL